VVAMVARKMMPVSFMLEMLVFVKIGVCDSLGSRKVDLDC